MIEFLKCPTIPNHALIFAALKLLENTQVRMNQKNFNISREKPIWLPTSEEDFPEFFAKL